MGKKYSKRKFSKFFLCSLFFVFVTLFLFSNVSGQSAHIDQYSYTGNTLSLQTGGHSGFYLNPSQDKLYHSDGDCIYEYSGNDDLSSFSYSDSMCYFYEYYTNYELNSIESFLWDESRNGKRLYIFDYNSADSEYKYYGFSCSNSYDLSSCSDTSIEDVKGDYIPSDTGGDMTTTNSGDILLRVMNFRSDLLRWDDFFNNNLWGELNEGFALDEGVFDSIDFDAGGVTISPDKDSGKPWYDNYYLYYIDDSSPNIKSHKEGFILSDIVKDPDSIKSKTFSSLPNDMDGITVSDDSEYIFVASGNTAYELQRNHSPQLSNFYPSDGSINNNINVTLKVDVTDSVDNYVDVRFMTGETELCNVNNVPSGSTVSCDWNNLDEDTEYNYHVESDDGEFTTTSDTKTFTTGNVTLKTRQAENITNSSAGLVGYIERINVDSIDVYFKYKNITSSTFIDTPVVDTLSSPQEFSYNLTNLSDGVEYEYKACTTYKNRCGNVETFFTNSTDPLLSTLDSTNINYTSFTMNGNLSDLGQNDQVFIRFEYRKQGVDSFSNTENIQVSSPQEYSYTLNNLDYNSTYEYRFCSLYGKKKCGNIKTVELTKPYSIDISINNFNFMNNYWYKWYEEFILQFTVTDIAPDYEFNSKLGVVKKGDQTCEDNVPIGLSTREQFKTCNSYKEFEINNINQERNYTRYISDLDAGETYHFMVFTFSDSYDINYLLSNGNNFESDMIITKEGIPINSIEELYSIRNNFTRDYYLSKSLDFCSENSYLTPYSGIPKISNFCKSEGADKGWIPFGMINGTFDGYGNIIKNLYINRPNESEVGLFSYIGNYYNDDGYEYSYITNLGITQADITGKNSVGIIAGEMDSSTINNSYVQGYVKGNEKVGGISGDCEGLINNTYSFANAEGFNVTGGLLGRAGSIVGNGKIYNSYHVGETFNCDNSACGSAIGKISALGYFDDIVYNSEYTTQNGIGLIHESASEVGNLLALSEPDMKDITTYTGIFDMVKVDNTSIRNNSFNWNIVDLETYPFLSIQNEYYKLEDLGKPELYKNIIDFDMNYNNSLIIDLDDHFRYVTEYHVSVGGKTIKENGTIEFNDLVIKLNNSELTLNTKSIRSEYDFNVKGINARGFTEDEFNLEITNTPEITYYGEEFDYGFLKTIVDFFVGLFPDEEKLNNIQKIGYVILIMLIFSGLILGITWVANKGITMPALYITLFVNIMIFLFMASIGYIPTAFFIWLAVILVVIGGIKLYRKYAEGGE